MNEQPRIRRAQPRLGDDRTIAATRQGPNSGAHPLFMVYIRTTVDPERVRTPPNENINAGLLPQYR